MRDAGTIPTVLRDFTARMRTEHAAVDTVDVTAGAWIYRVFLLANTLQVDLAFAPAVEFGARAPTFRLVHGAAADLPLPAPPAPAFFIAMAWLYALHVRSSIARGKLWQAHSMLSSMREQVVSLACLRRGLPYREGRGADELPADVKTRLDATLARWTEADELHRAFVALIDLLLDETRLADGELATRIAGTVRALAS